MALAGAASAATPALPGSVLPAPAVNGTTASASAWELVYRHWHAWQVAQPWERPQAARQLNAALQALEQAWQQAESRTEPFFYAVDMATRMQA
jgi:hypothetical protein